MCSRSLLSLTAAGVLLLGLTSCGNDDRVGADPSAGATPSGTPASSPTESTTESPTEPPESTKPTESTESTEPTESPTEAPTESPTESPRLIDYEHDDSPGVTVQSRADARKLHGAPASFKQFAGETAEQLEAKTTCDDAAVGLTVEKVRTDGFAIGGVNECGGYLALWAVVDGQWKEIAGTQDAWGCAELMRHRVPSDIAGDTCYAYHGDHQEHPYHQA